MLRFLLLLLMMLVPRALPAAGPVAVELVLALDVSASISDREYVLQRDGVAATFADPQVGRVIAETPGGLAVAVAHWAGPGLQAVALDWRILRTRADALAFAAALSGQPRQVIGATDPGQAIAFAHRLIEENAILSARKVIDVSGDGIGSPQGAARARDRAVAAGITINGLAIYNGAMGREGLATFYRDFIIGGGDAFLMGAEGLEDFPRAFKRKLLREIGVLSLAGAR